LISQKDGTQITEQCLEINYEQKKEKLPASARARPPRDGPFLGAFPAGSFAPQADEMIVGFLVRFRLVAAALLPATRAYLVQKSLLRLGTAFNSHRPSFPAFLGASSSRVVLS